MKYIVEYHDCATLAEKHGPDFTVAVEAYLNAAAEDGLTLAGILPNGSAAGLFIFVDAKAEETEPPAKAETAAG